MRFSTLLVSVTSLMATQVFAGAVGDVAEMANIDKRGCGTGNWCCTVANPSAYCAKYCTHGSQYINCYESYVSIIALPRMSSYSPPPRVVAISHPLTTTVPSVPSKRSMPVQMPLLRPGI